MRTRFKIPLLVIGIVAIASLAWLVYTEKIRDFGKRPLRIANNKVLNNDLESKGGVRAAQKIQAPPTPVDESADAVEMVRRLGGTTLIATTGHVIAINLTGCEVRNDDLACLEHTPELNLLNLDNTPIADDGLRFIRVLPKLKTLRLCRTKITDQGLQNLENLPSLTTLHLDDTLITDAGIEHLTRFSKLNAVFAMGSSVTGAAQKTLPHCRIKS